MSDLMNILNLLKIQFGTIKDQILVDFSFHSADLQVLDTWPGECNY